MKAITYTKYGSPSVLQLKDVAKPAPQKDEVLVRVHAASINSRDWRLMCANPFFIRMMVGGLLRPKNPLLGADVAGQVERVGSNVTQFRPEDEVFGCISAYDRGTFAEYVCVKESDIVLKPANVSFEQAAAVPLAALTALQGLRKGNIHSGQRVLIQGASGGVGIFAVQIAKALGAEVTAVCSTRNVDMVRALGADHVIDYKKENFTRNGQRYDLILAVNGYHPISDYLHSLTPDGIYAVAGGYMLQFLQATLRARRDSKTGGQRTYVISEAASQQDLLFIKELLENGKVVPVIDGCYPLGKTVEAFRYFETMHARGKVVITVG
jgi:NADPH:quinone reductase-like Zn-dependent oxidoreductase